RQGRPQPPLQPGFPASAAAPDPGAPSVARGGPGSRAHGQASAEAMSEPEATTFAALLIGREGSLRTQRRLLATPSCCPAGPAGQARPSTLSRALWWALERPRYNRATPAAAGCVVTGGRADQLTEVHAFRGVKPSPICHAAASFAAAVLGLKVDPVPAKRSPSQNGRRAPLGIRRRRSPVLLYGRETFTGRDKGPTSHFVLLDGVAAFDCGQASQDAAVAWCRGLRVSGHRQFPYRAKMTKICMYNFKSCVTWLVLLLLIKISGSTRVEQFIQSTSSAVEEHKLSGRAAAVTAYCASACASKLDCDFFLACNDDAFDQLPAAASAIAATPHANCLIDAAKRVESTGLQQVFARSS
uniref:Apple domain-containing protein n=1 Tax=Macrostomum lignano TaxID=282301 RepID=A0A1I8JP10_9PLAT